MDEIKVDPSRLTIGDLEVFERAQTGQLKIADMVGILSRLTGMDESAIRALNMEKFRLLTEQIGEAIKAIGSGPQGEALGGNSTDISGREKGRRRSNT
jgi:hypothetical protein